MRQLQYRFTDVAFFSVALVIQRRCFLFFRQGGLILSWVTRFCSVDKRAWENRRLSNKRDTVFVLYLMMISPRRRFSRRPRVVCRVVVGGRVAIHFRGICTSLLLEAVVTTKYLSLLLFLARLRSVRVCITWRRTRENVFQFAFTTRPHGSFIVLTRCSNSSSGLLLGRGRWWKLNVRFFFDLHATGSSVSQTRWTDWRSGDSRGYSRRRARRRSVLVLR